MKRLPIILAAVYIGIFILFLVNTYISYRVKPENVLSAKTNTLSIEKYNVKHKKVVYGFLPYWMLNKLKYIQTDKLTHIAYFALNINEDGTIRRIDEEGNSDPGYNIWKNSTALKDFIVKAKANGVEMSLTIISHDTEINDAFLDCTSCWVTLYNEVDEELKRHDLRSINLDFEYPEYTKKEKALKYSQFVAFMNKQLERGREKEGMEVIVSTFADATIKPRVTDIETLNEAADGIFVMAYDFHYSESETAGPVAPINGGGKLYNYDLTSMLNDYTKYVSPSKLILGVPYYGYNWVVESEQPYSARIPGDDYIGYSQSQTYEFIMDTLLTMKPNVTWDPTSLTPYFSYVSPTTGSIRQVHFENIDSLKIKYELVFKYNLKGAGIWALGYDGGYQELWDVLSEQFGS